jgi:hypothetical protein
MLMESHCSPRTLHQFVVLFMRLVYWYVRESVCGLGNNPMTMFFKFLLNGRGQAFHVTGVNGNPSDIVLVIKSKEPRDDQSLQ